MKSIVSRATGRRHLLKGASALAGVVAMPAIVKGQSGTIKVGVPTILSGRVAVLGQTTVGGLKMTFDKFNAAGGLGGRKIEIITRDSKGKPDEAANKYAPIDQRRRMRNYPRRRVLGWCVCSAGSDSRIEGAVRPHQFRDASSLSADPKIRVPTAFRAARQGIHDAIVSATYAANIAKAKGLKTWNELLPGLCLRPG